MKKFTKNFFAIKDNTLNQKLGAIIDSKAFKVQEGKMKEELQILSDDILKFYAACFCGGRIPQAAALATTLGWFLGIANRDCHWRLSLGMFSIYCHLPKK